MPAVPAFHNSVPALVLTVYQSVKNSSADLVVDFVADFVAGSVTAVEENWAVVPVS